MAKIRNEKIYFQALGTMKKNAYKDSKAYAIYIFEETSLTRYTTVIL